MTTPRRSATAVQDAPAKKAVASRTVPTRVRSAQTKTVKAVQTGVPGAPSNLASPPVVEAVESATERKNRVARERRAAAKVEAAAAAKAAAKAEAEAAAAKAAADAEAAEKAEAKAAAKAAAKAEAEAQAAAEAEAKERKNRLARERRAAAKAEAEAQAAAEAAAAEAEAAAKAEAEAKERKNRLARERRAAAREQAEAAAAQAAEKAEAARLRREQAREDKAREAKGAAQDEARAARGAAVLVADEHVTLTKVVPVTKAASGTTEPTVDKKATGSTTAPTKTAPPSPAPAPATTGRLGWLGATAAFVAGAATMFAGFIYFGTTETGQPLRERVEVRWEKAEQDRVKALAAQTDREASRACGIALRQAEVAGAAQASVATAKVTQTAGQPISVVLQAGATALRCEMTKTPDGSYSVTYAGP